MECICSLTKVIHRSNIFISQVLWLKAQGHKKAKTCEDLTESEDSGNDDILAKHHTKVIFLFDL